MGCLVALLALLSPRLSIFFLWLYTDRMRLAFTSGLLAVVGFLFLPWTTLAWAVAYQPAHGVKGFGWFVVGLAVLVDLSSSLNGERRRRSMRLRRQN
jgi:hypothetical protein